MKLLEKISFFIILFFLSTMTYAATTKEPPMNPFSKYRDHIGYDSYFIKYSKRFFGPEFDWKIFKSQAIAESNLNKDAKSYLGAEGLMQIMPDTYHEISQKCPYIKGLINNPRWNIAAGIYYNKTLWDIWSSNQSDDRIFFMFASYNAGKGNIIKAQKVALQKGLDPYKWSSIENTLTIVTGKRSRETVDYIQRIIFIRKVL